MAVTLNNAAVGRSTAEGDGVGIADAMTSADVSGVVEIRREDDTPVIVIGTGAPSDADGRPDNTVYIQISS